MARTPRAACVDSDALRTRSVLLAAAGIANAMLPIDSTIDVTIGIFALFHFDIRILNATYTSSPRDLTLKHSRAE